MTATLTCEAILSKPSFVLASVILLKAGFKLSIPSWISLETSGRGAGSAGLGGTFALGAGCLTSVGCFFAVLILVFLSTGFFKFSNTNFLYSISLGP